MATQSLSARVSIESQIAALLSAVASDDDEACKVLTSKIAGDLLTNINRIADALEAIANNTQRR